MASTTTAQIASLLAYRGRSGVYRQYLTRLPELACFTYKPAEPGSSASWPLVFESANDTAFHTPGDDYAAPDPGVKTTASLAYMEATRTAGVHDLAQALARGSFNFEGGAGLKKFEIDNEAVKLLKILATAFYTGNPSATPPELCGLDYVCGTSTFAGVNPATSGQETWVGTTESVTEVAFNADPVGVLRDSLLGPMADLGYRPKVVFCEDARIRKIIAATDTAPAQVRSMPIGNGFTVADLGGVGAIVDSTIFMPSPNTPTGKFYALDPEYLEYQFVPREIDTALMALTMSEILGRQVTEHAVQRLLNRALNVPPIWFEDIAKTGTQQKVGLVTHGQAKFLVRAAFGRLALT